MIHYTILPDELIFYDPELQHSKQKRIEIDGVLLLVEQTSEHQATIVQLLSPDPQDFLNPRFQPGKQLGLFPKI